MKEMSLSKFYSKINSSRKTILDDDIYITYNNSQEPMSLSSTLDGNGHTIHNISKILFEDVTEYGEFKNASLIVSDTFEQDFVICNKNEGLISDISTDVEAGGTTSVIEVNTGEIIDCSVNIKQPDMKKEKVSGLCKNNGGLIENCSVEGKLESKNYAGGVVSNNMGEIIDCEFSGEIVVRKGYLGGIVGVNKSGKIINCVTKDSKLSSTSTIFTSRNGIGGICGVNPEHGGIEKCESRDSELEGGNCGGIVSTNRGVVKECKSTVKLEAGRHVGGIAAELISEFSYTFKCGFDGNIVDGKNQGGLCGLIKEEAKCFDCYSKWNPELREPSLLFGSVGGTVGLKNCYYLGMEDIDLIDTDRRPEKEAGVMKVDSGEEEIKTVILS